jgi:PAS domain S-box-containing protein
LLLSAAAAIHLRNRQQQALRLTAASRALAEKSSALNTEVTERARLNNVFRKAERENKAVIDSISDIIFEVTGEGEIVFLNKAWEKITGFTVEQSLQRKLFDMLHPQDQEEQRRNFEQMVKGQKSAYRVLTRIRTANGTFRSVELAVSMLRLDENRNMRVVGAMTDVEERRRAEKALGEVEKKYRTIVENAAGGIYQVTPEGQFLSANPAMARILGYDSTEQMLREVKNAHVDIYEDRQEHSRYLGQLEKFGSVKNFENRVRARDGRLVWVNENARSVKDDESNILYYEGSMEDITRRKEIEIKLREAKIQSDLANRAKSEFLANMSHELRTPLNAIIGFSEIIKDEVLGPMQNRQYWEYARDIHGSGKGLLKIISEILEISRIEAGERQMVEGVVDISKVANSCVEFLGPKAEAGKLIVSNNLASSPKIIGEELAVKQILLNLLSNAIKFTPAGGHITLSHETDTEGQLRISVTDTGIGLDEEEIVKALSPFGQVDSTLGRSGSGTGLGLTLVDSLVRMHGGKLELFSQKGLGTTATLIFPAKRVAQEGS